MHYPRRGSTPTMTQLPADDRDVLTRFLLQEAGVRGVCVHLEETWRQIRARAEYPAAIEELLGEACAAAALFTGHAKVDGRLSVQLRGDGPLRTLFAECTAAGTLRGIAQYEGGSPVSRDLRELGENALLVITIENPGIGDREPVRYQGIVGLESDALAGAFEGYFRQSEQLPTRLLLAVDSERVAGLMLQKLPGDAGDEDGWTRASILFDTLSSRELLGWSTETLLQRLFPEDTIEVFGSRQLGFACSCSRERVESMLQSLGEEEALAAAADDVAEIRCEFCGQQYRFDPEQIGGLFRTRGIEAPPPARLQ